MGLECLRRGTIHGQPGQYSLQQQAGTGLRTLSEHDSQRDWEWGGGATARGCQAKSRHGSDRFRVREMSEQRGAETSGLGGGVLATRWDGP